jgi:uncharacterized phage protein (TIGR02218 family)
MTTGFVLPYVYLTTITPKNNFRIGFCSSNLQVIWDAVGYRGDVGSQPTTTQSTQGLAVDSMEFTILKPTYVSDLGFDEYNVANGLFDEATAEIHVEDLGYLPATRTASTHKVFDGFVGRVTTNPTSFKFELRSNSTKIARNSVNRTSPFCPFSFGDSFCTKNLVSSGLQYNITANSVPQSTGVGQRQDFSTNVLYPALTVPNFAGGELKGTSGRNLGFSRLVQAVNTAGTVAFEKPFPYQVDVGDTFTIKAACNKTQDACKAYNNFDRFGGFPTGGGYMRGLDTILLPGVNSTSSAE